MDHKIVTQNSLNTLPDMVRHDIAERKISTKSFVF